MKTRLICCLLLAIALGIFAGARADVIHFSASRGAEVPIEGYFAYNADDGEITLANLDFALDGRSGRARFVKTGAKRANGRLVTDNNGFIWEGGPSYYDASTKTAHIEALGVVHVPGDGSEAMCFNGGGQCGALGYGAIYNRTIAPVAKVTVDIAIDDVPGPLEDSDFTWSIQYPDQDPVQLMIWNIDKVKARPMPFYGPTYYPMAHPNPANDMTGYFATDSETGTATFMVPEPSSLILLCIGLLLWRKR